ncbi:hypothetical protein BDC45DRAFT_575766 [Circinella umbellata]|nr:hypothetical protein BDC45DRAFT_575766 [Circinella umbellata]
MKSRSLTNSRTRNLPAATSCAITWTILLPSLVKAYVEGYGIQAPKSEELAPLPSPICSCVDKSLYNSHLFPMTPEVPGIAIHAPASLKGRLNEALPVYNRVVLSVWKELCEKSGVVISCAGCRFMSGPKPIAMDGNFQHRHFARNKDLEGVVYPGDDGENNSHY